MSNSPGVARRARLALQASPSRVTVAGFAVAVVVGTLVLMLPASSADGTSTDALAAAFTTVSALCVTGLIVVDTATHWSILGQAVIVGLIQVGGFGVMTLASVLARLLALRMGLRERITVASMTRSDGMGSLGQTLLRIAGWTLLIEALTALWLAMWFQLQYDYSPARALWHGVFHAVSAFNNAGFALYSLSLMDFASDWGVLLPICGAVILGGLGFPVIVDLARTYRLPRKWALNTRLVLLGTAGLLGVGTLLLLVNEWRNPATLGPLSVGDKILNAFAQSAFTRTAGFNSVDIAQLNEGSWFLMDILMIIGTGPAGTGGGLKITTVLVLVLVARSAYLNRTDVAAFGRRIPSAVQREAIAVVTLGAGVVLLATGVVLALSPFDLGIVLYEVVSAFATVGLSTGITAALPPAAQLTLMACMFIGRLGPITLANSLARRQPTRQYEFPTERPIIG
ncbi:TrkH family potassium uptake protein [Corynebacterium guangdongense]|uniref:Potassium uptake TrkH family protein n=1 Tax=Corynebacterium guangdongense TaxID=1783348 RepID=A0ABU2A0Z8_9CORY|nr:potassium transporter TrkG [Corynebacterium guangdongense]MDR7330862.1 potassium uptake TrkH family protein [Corynebacterium guangdongense]WJZ16877.1 Ktr system potassium uptake protein B [Corynebacterium guangdongense]